MSRGSRRGRDQARRRARHDPSAGRQARRVPERRRATIDRPGGPSKPSISEKSVKRPRPRAQLTAEKHYRRRRRGHRSAASPARCQATVGSGPRPALAACGPVTASANAPVPKVILASPDFGSRDRRASLLIDDTGGDRQPPHATEVSGARHNLREAFAGHAEQSTEIVVPAACRKVHERGAGRGCDIGDEATRHAVEEECIGCSEAQAPGAGKRSRFGHLAQQPTQLGRGEVWIERQPSAVRTNASAPSLRIRSVTSRVRSSCHTITFARARPDWASHARQLSPWLSMPMAAISPVSAAASMHAPIGDQLLWIMFNPPRLRGRSAGGRGWRSL